MNDSNELTYPTNQVFATVDAPALGAALYALAGAGVTSDDLTTWTPSDAEPEDAEETGGGFWSRLVSNFGSEREIIDQLQKQVVENNRAVVMVAVDGDEEKLRVADVLRGVGAEGISYASQWTVERLH